MNAKDTLDNLKARATDALGQGDFEQARRHYLQALDLSDDHPDLHYGLATSSFLLQDFAAAVRHFKEVIRLDPVRAGAYVNLGAVYNRMGNFEDAVAALRKGIQLDPRRAEGYYNLGVVYRHMGDHEMALQAYREAMRINPRMADAHYNIANIFLERQDFAKAAGYYQNALEIRPNWEKARKGLAACHAGLEGLEVEAPSGVVQLPPEKNRSALDPNRLIDPAVHGELLRDIHHLIIDMQTDASALYESAHKDIEAALRELSNALLFPKNPNFNLGKQLDRFDEVVAKLSKLHGALKKKVEKTRQTQEKLTSF